MCHDGFAARPEMSMAEQPIQDDLPLLYRHLLPEFFEQSVPVEAFATCSNCIMVCDDPNRAQLLTKRPYRPDTKCCTFQPDLPNYLVGGLLSSTDPMLEDGRARMRERIRQRTGVSPMGVYAPRLYNVLYRHGARHGFGRSITLLCPYYRGAEGACTIWKFREASCSTWFCKTVSGTAGRDFWSAVKIYLSASQNALIRYTMLKAGLKNGEDLIQQFDDPPQDSSYLSAEEIDGLPPPQSEYAAKWEGWGGDEESYFVQCHEWIERLDRPQFDAIMGTSQTPLLADLTKKRDLAQRIPERLGRNDALPFERRNDEIYIVMLADSEITMELPIEFIDTFDGSRTTSEVRRYLKDETELEIEDELLLTLFQHHVLLEIE